MKDEISKLLEGIARDVKLTEGAAAIKSLLVELHRKGSTSLRSLADVTRLPPPAVSILLNKLSAAGIIHRDKAGIKYTENGMKYVENEIGILSLSLMMCGSCEGTGYEIDPERRHSRLFDRLNAIVECRPDADVTVDQSKCTIDTIARRLFFMHNWHAFDGTSILFLGDDDFISIASCSPEFIDDYFIIDPTTTTKPFKATVLDIDDRIIGKIGEIANQLLIRNLSIVKHDVRKPLPADLLHRFDVVFTDPPYTLNGCKLFLSRAIDVLRKENGSRVFLSFGHVSPELMGVIQTVIAQSGFVIEALYPSFNRYEGANIIGNISQMFVLGVYGALNPVIPSDEEYSGELYTSSQVAINGDMREE